MPLIPPDELTREELEAIRGDADELTPEQLMKRKEYYEKASIPPPIKTHRAAKNPGDILPKDLIERKDYQEKFLPIESAALGAVRGATRGTSPYIEGAAVGGFNALTSDATLLDAYRTARDKALARDAKAQADNPWSYGMGNIGTTIATGLIPGLGGASVARSLGEGALMGAAYSPGDLTKGEYGQVASDALTGGAIGYGAHTALSGLGKAAGGAANLASRVIPSVAKKAGSVAFNMPEESVGRYLDAKKAGRDIMKGPKEYQVAQAVGEDMERLKGDVIGGSKASRAQLEFEGTNVDANLVADMYARKKASLISDSMGINTNPAVMATISRLDQMEKAWRDYAKGTPATSKVSPILQESGQPFVREIPGKPGQSQVPAGRLKDDIQMLQREADWPNRPTDFPKIDDRAAMDLQRQQNEYLKGLSPAYRRLMEETAADTKLLYDMGKVVPSDRAGLNVYRRAMTDEHGAGQLPMETLRQFDQRMGSSHLESAADAVAQRILSNPKTAGSRGVNLYKNTLGQIPIIGPAGGAIIGGAVDKVGTPMAVGSLNMAAKLSKALSQGGREAFMREAGPVMQAAAAGDKSAALALYLIQKRHPEAFQEGQQ